MQISSLAFVAAISGVVLARVPKHKDADTTQVYSGTSTGVYSSTTSVAYEGSSQKAAASSTTTTTVIVVSTSVVTAPATSSMSATTTMGTSTGTSTTSSIVSDCATPILNSGFEYTTMVQWRRQYPNPETPYDFKVTSDVTSPHAGNQLASITYINGAQGYQTWFNQFISLCPSTLYNFQSYTKVSKEGTGCNVSYSIGDRNGTVVAGLVGHSSEDLTTEWLMGTATYRSGTGVEAVKAAIDVRVQCYGTATEERAWYFDDVSLVAAKHT